MTNRARTDILAKILETVNDHCEDSDGVTQTTIRYEVFLSGAQLKEHLIALTLHGLAITQQAAGITLQKRVYGFFRSTMR
jgi:predicted transcriptional regulator